MKGSVLLRLDNKAIPQRLEVLEISMGAKCKRMACYMELN